MPIKAKQQPDEKPFVDPDAPQSRDPRDLPRSYGHNHPAAFSVVQYKGVETGTLEEIWNAWDGPPPEQIEISATGEKADCTRTAIYAPDYMPDVGETIGVPLTEARARVACREGLDKLQAKGGNHVLEAAQHVYASESECIDDMVRELMSKHYGDTLTVTSGYLEALRDARAQGLISHHPPAPTLTARYGAELRGKLVMMRATPQPANTAAAPAPDTPAADTPPPPEDGAALLDALDARMRAGGATVAATTFIALPPAGKVTRAAAGSIGDVVYMWCAVEGPDVLTGKPAAALILTSLASSKRVYQLPRESLAAGFDAGQDLLRAHGMRDLHVQNLADKVNTVGSATIDVLRARGVEPTAVPAEPNLSGRLTERVEWRLRQIGFIAPGVDPHVAERCKSHAIVDPQEISDGNIVIAALMRDPHDGHYEIVASPGAAWALALPLRHDMSRALCLNVYDTLIQRAAQQCRGRAIPTDADGRPLPYKPKPKAPKAKA